MIKYSSENNGELPFTHIFLHLFVEPDESLESRNTIGNVYFRLELFKPTINACLIRLINH